MMTIEERETARAIQTIAHEIKRPKEIDWEQRRYEIAKEVLAGFMANPDWRGYEFDYPLNKAISYADALISKLKERLKSE